MKPTTSHNIDQIFATWNVTASQESSLWNKIMKETLNLNIKVCKRSLTVLLLKKLHHKQVGTPDVENFLKNNVRVNYVKRAMRRNMMKVKMIDATFEMQKIKKKFQARMEYLQRRWGQNKEILKDFKEIMQREIEEIWETGREKVKSKIKFLNEKWGKQREPVGSNFRGIAISDEALEEKFPPVPNKVSKYGNVETNEFEDAALSLPPGFREYGKIKIDDINAASEAMITKARWEMRSRKERGGKPWSEEFEWNQVQQKTVFDDENRMMEFSKRRVTDLPSNRRIEVPDPSENEEEIVFANMKKRISAVAKEFIDKKCRKDGALENNNITAEVMKGVESLKKRSKEGEIVITMTDKSKKMSVNTRENYIQSMQQHIQEDEVLSWKEKEKIENNLNGHTIQAGRILKVGENYGHEDRVKNALRNKNCHVPEMSGLAKDHKEGIDERVGPPSRPVVQADESNVCQLSHMMTEICQALAEEMDKTVQSVNRSTEDMLAETERVNNSNEAKNLTVFSMDFKNFYPGLNVAECGKVVREEYLKSELKVDVNVTEAGLYLAIVKEREELVSLGLGEVTHTRRRETGKKPGITTEEILKRGKSSVSKFTPPQRLPTQQEERLMTALVLENFIRVGMENNIYSFNSEIRRKSEGGGIGSDLTGAVATIRAIKFARDLKKKVEEATRDSEALEDFKIHSQRCYVDDGKFITEALPPGSKVEEGKVVIDPEDEEVDARPNDERTAEIFKTLGNTISDDIEVTVDFPSNNLSGWMPILDCEVKVEDNKILYKFYKKPMASPLVMMKDSALPENIKRSSLIQEVVRRLRNTKRSLPWDLKAEILSEFSNSMKLSGYPENYRQNIIKSGIEAFEKICDESDTGGTPLYRPRGYKQKERRKKKLMTKTSWYRPEDAVGFYPVTPGGELAKEIKKIVDEEGGRIGMKIKIAETGGPSIRAKLSNTNLTGCPIPACFLCEGGEGGASHTRSGALYKGTCKLCGKTYWGETGDNGYTRFNQHKESIKRMEKTNAFAKHLSIEHPDQQKNPDTFKMKVEKTYQKPLDRQVMEGVKIATLEPEETLNSRAEYLQPAVVRIRATRELPDNDGTLSSNRRAGGS